ncbi:MAG: ribonuclease E/G [Pseudomonadota bacterium]
MVDGRLEDLVISPDTDFAPGAVFRGTVERVVKGGAFVTLPGGQGFLRGGGKVKQGHSVLGQVSSFAEPGKAIPLTERLVFKGRTVVVTPGADGMNLSRQIKNEDERLRLFSAVDTFKAATSSHGIVVRTAAQRAENTEIEEEVDRILDWADDVLAKWKGPPALLSEALSPAAYAQREWMSSEDRIWAAEDAFERHGVLDAIEKLRGPSAKLGEGSMVTERTRALVAVDVNTGGDFSPASGLKANLAVARELPRQLRLRGLGGKIAVDFAPMPKNQRRTLEEALKKAFRADAIETSLVGWTTLGLFELQRKRERWPLMELI